MEAKETVIKNLRRKRVEVPSVLGGRLLPQVGHVNIDAELEHQAEVSFNAGQENVKSGVVCADCIRHVLQDGRREVVDWVENHALYHQEARMDINWDEWQSKLKEWAPNKEHFELPDPLDIAEEG